MILPGVDKFKKKTGLPFQIFPFIVFGIGLPLSYFIASLGKNYSLLPAIVQIGIEGFWINYAIFGFMGHRESYRKRFGKGAYRKAFYKFLIPLAILLLGQGLTLPIFISYGPKLPLYFLFLLIGIVIGIIHLLLILKAIRTFGVDRAVLIYSYHPEEGELIKSRIYDFIRHPLYAGLIGISCALGLISGHWIGLLCAAIYSTKLVIWYHYEEHEVFSRFGPSYKDYCKKTPAIFPRLKQIPSYLKELVFFTKHKKH